MKLADEQHEQLMRGKSTLDYGRTIESTVRQQDAELVRELVEALKHARGYSPVIAVAITRAQQWLEGNK